MENSLLNDKIQQIVDRLLSLANQVYYLHTICQHSAIIDKIHRELLMAITALSEIMK